MSEIDRLIPTEDGEELFSEYMLISLLINPHQNREELARSADDASRYADAMLAARKVNNG